MTKGEYRVGISFNPSNSGLVADIKTRAAELIDLIESIEVPHYPETGHDQTDELDRQRRLRHLGEVNRLKAMAQSDIEVAAMNAVKAATKPKPEVA